MPTSSCSQTFPWRPASESLNHSSSLPAKGAHLTGSCTPPLVHALTHFCQGGSSPQHRWCLHRAVLKVSSEASPVMSGGWFTRKQIYRAVKHHTQQLGTACTESQLHTSAFQSGNNLMMCLSGKRAEKFLFESHVADCKEKSHSLYRLQSAGKVSIQSKCSWVM